MKYVCKSIKNPCKVWRLSSWFGHENNQKEYILYGDFLVILLYVFIYMVFFGHGFLVDGYHDLLCIQILYMVI